MKCVVCDRRKGKRFCPAKQTMICAPCCGEKRVVEIPCPHDCTYLTSGQGYQRGKSFVAQLERLDTPYERREMLQTFFSHTWIIEKLEETVAAFAASLSTLSDEHVLEALSQVREGYEIEERGLIFTPSSSNPLVENLASKLREATESARNEQKAEMRQLTPASLLEALRFLEMNVKHFLDEGGTDGYLRFVRKSHPKAGKASEKTQTIIQP